MEGPGGVNERRTSLEPPILRIRRHAALIQRDVWMRHRRDQRLTQATCTQLDGAELGPVGIVRPSSPCQPAPPNGSGAQLRGTGRSCSAVSASERSSKEVRYRAQQGEERCKGRDDPMCSGASRHYQGRSERAVARSAEAPCWAARFSHVDVCQIRSPPNGSGAQLQRLVRRQATEVGRRVGAIRSTCTGDGGRCSCEYTMDTAVRKVCAGRPCCHRGDQPPACRRVDPHP